MTPKTAPKTTPTPTAVYAANPAVRAVLYLRAARDPRGLAVERQRDACLRLARERGWTVTGEYSDTGASAAAVTRPGYDAMTADYAAGRFDAIVVWHLDRLTRQPRQLGDWIDAAEGGLQLVTAHGETDLTTDAGRMYARFLAGALA